MLAQVQIVNIHEAYLRLEVRLVRHHVVARCHYLA